MMISGMKSKISNKNNSINKVKKPVLVTGSVLLWIFVWQIGAMLANRSLLIKIPYPIDTVKMFLANLTSLDFWGVVGISVLNILTGFLLAVILGVLLGMLSARFELFNILISPLLHLIRTVPVAAIVIVAWLWIPSSALASFISFLMVLPIVWSHTISGLKSVDVKLIEMAKINKMSPFDIAFKIKLPLISPYIRTGCLTGVGIAWKSGVAAQVIASPADTLGSLLRGAKTSIDYTEVFAITLTIVLLSVIIENILKLVWRERRYD